MISAVRKKIAINESLGTITIKQKDALSRYVELSLVDVDNITPINLYGCSVRVYVEFPDSNYIFFNGNVVDGDRGIVSFLIPSGATQNIGIFNAELCLMCSDNSRLSTYEFKIEVLSTLIDDSAVEAEQDFSALQVALTTVDNLEKELETAINTVGNLEQELRETLSNVGNAGQGTQSHRDLEEQMETALNAINSLERELQTVSGNVNTIQQQSQTTIKSLYNLEQESRAFEKNINLNEHAYVKPLYLAETNGYAAQSIAYIGNGVYIIGFSSKSGSDALLVAFNERTKAVLGSASAVLGHVNSLGYDGEYLYSPSDNGSYVNRFKVSVTVSGVSVSDFSTLRAGTGISVQSVFDCDGEIYAVGTKDDEVVIWQLAADDPEYISVTLPDEAPRTNQTWAADGTYLYWLRSNPNAVAVFDFASGEFIRWSGIGDFVGGSMMIGEVEMLCFAEGKARLISQYYYPNSISTAKRFWLFSSLMWSKELPPDQQHWYPNEHRKIYVSNANPGGGAIRTNQGDDYSKDVQTGTENYPYPSFETALYAAMATPNIPNEIIMLNTGTDYRIEDVVLRIPGMNIIITCLGKVTFEHIHLPTGILTITGNCYFERITTTNRSILQISDGTFASKSLIDGAAPYQLGGTVSITNGRWYKSANQSDDILFEFAAGANGVVGFNTTDAPLTDSDGGVLSAPRSNSIQQLNLTLYNVRNAGRRDRWTAVYSGDTDIQIGNIIATTLSDFYVNDGIVCRVKWRAENGEYYNAIAHVNGDTVADLSAMAGTGTDTKYRVVKMRFRPRIYDSATGEWINGDIRVMSVTDYSVVQGAVVSTVTDAGSLPAGVEIAEIAVRGY